MTRARRSLALALACVAGCGEEPPAGFVTEHVVAEPTDSDQICRGTLDDMEAQVVRIAAALDVEVPHPITVHYGPSAVEQHCDGLPDARMGGCADGTGDRTLVAGDLAALSHLLVHAVRRTNGARGPSFFEEGIAIVLGGFRPFAYRVRANPGALPPERGPTALVALTGGSFPPNDDGVAAHFMAWLLEVHGQERVAMLLKDERLADDAAEVFTEHFGISLADAESDWRASSREEYVFGEVCDPDRAIAWSGDSLEYSARLACDAPNVIGPSVENMTLRSACFRLTRPGTFRVELSASAGRASIRPQEDCLAVGPLSAEHYQEKSLLAGESFDLPLAACSWEVIVSTELAAPTDFTLRLTR